MYPIYASRPMSQNKLNKALACALAVAFLATVTPVLAAAKKPTKSQELEAPIAGAVTVSDYEFNTFVFPIPVKRVFFPSDAPVSGKPIYLAENTQVMLQFKKGSGNPVQMVAELENSSVVTVRVVPRAVPGVVHSVNGARIKVSPAARKEASAGRTTGAPRSEDLELLKYLMTNHEAPAGFDPVKLPSTVRFDKFSVVPLASWSNGADKRIHIFSLAAVPGQTAVVAPPQFYRDGITAVMLDGDVVDDNTTAQLFIVEELNDE